MRRYRLLLHLHIKSAFRSLPGLLAGTLAFALLVGLVGFTGMKFLQSGNEKKRMQIALVLPSDSDRYTDTALSFISEIDTVKNICTFTRMDKESAFLGLKDGSLQGVILIPDRFVEHIQNGTNTPAEIILPHEGPGSDAGLFRRIVNAGVDDIAAAQAGIYAVDDVCSYYQIQDGVAKSEAFLNAEYLSYALDRTAYFNSKPLSVEGSLSTTQFYICSGLVFLLLLCGIVCYDILKRDPAVLQNALRRKGFPLPYISFCRLTGISLVYFLILLSAYGMTMLSSIRFEAVRTVIPVLRISEIASLFLLIFGIYSFVLFIYSCSQTQSTGLILLFAVSTVMMFASGGFLPSSMLPDALRQAAVILPSTWYLKLAIQLMSGSVSLVTITINALFALVFTAGASYVGISGKISTGA